MVRSGAALVTAVAVLAGSGCSGDLRLPSSSPTSSSTGPSESSTLPVTGDVYRDTRTFALSAGSGHVVGTVERDGEPVTLEIEGSASGTNQAVRVTAEGVGTAEVLTVGGRSWLSGDEDFWTERLGSARKARAAVGTYVPVSAAEAAEVAEVAEVADHTLRGVLSDQFGLEPVAALEGDTDPVVADVVDGRTAWLLGDEDGARVWVAADGSAELLRIVVPGRSPSDLVFTDWERARTFDSPAAGEPAEE